MVEWYRPGDDFPAALQLLSDLAEEIFARGPARPITYAEAFSKSLAIDPHRATAAELAALAERQGDFGGGQFCRAIATPGWICSWSSGSSRCWAVLGRRCCAITRPRKRAGPRGPRDPAVAERFELYLDGIELANGYVESLDPGLRRTGGIAQRAATANRNSRPRAACWPRWTPACRRRAAWCLGFDLAIHAGDFRRGSHYWEHAEFRQITADSQVSRKKFPQG